jgi:hypothetical protein
LEEYAMKLQALRTFASAFAVAAFTIGAAQADPMTPARQFVDGFNSGDAKIMLATCASATDGA